MAIFYPSLHDLATTSYKRAKPTEKEMKLLQFFSKQLNDKYEIYFRPFFNGFRPSFVLFRESTGMAIIDFYQSFKEFSYDESDKIIHPNRKFEMQKFELMDLTLSPEQKTKHGRSFLTTIKGIAIIEEPYGDIKAVLGEPRYYQYFSYQDFFSPQSFKYYLSRNYLDRPSPIYNEECYKEIRRHLKPSLHTIDEGQAFNPNERQNRLMISQSGDQRVKGAAGTGKTTVLAHKAVNSQQRTQSEVLILSFNITIRHYIKYKIEQVRKEFLRSDFHISHYHDFFKHQSLQFKNSRPKIGDWENTNYFNSVADKLYKYNAIIIDEAQDYRRSWVEILKKYFLKENGEFVIYFDTNQDIYQRKSTESFPIIGRPNQLTKSYRLSTKISTLTKNFYNAFLNDDEGFEIEPEKLALDFTEFKENITYQYFDRLTDDETIYRYIKENILLSNSSPDDIAIIGTSIYRVREAEYFFRTVKHEKTTAMFETKEEYEELEEKHKDNKFQFKMALKDLRRQYKLHKFFLTTGSMKFSSLHSFKGWEIHTVFLIITDDDFTGYQTGDESEEDFLNEQLIYTGITRARHNLNIINLGSERYHHFFKSEVAAV